MNAQSIFSKELLEEVRDLNLEVESSLVQMDSDELFSLLCSSSSPVEMNTDLPFESTEMELKEVFEDLRLRLEKPPDVQVCCNTTCLCWTHWRASLLPDSITSAQLNSLGLRR